MRTAAYDEGLDSQCYYYEPPHHTLTSHRKPADENIWSLVHQAKAQNELATLRLPEEFAPLINKWIRLSAWELPWEDGAVLAAEVHYVFLILLLEYQPERGVPFDGYIHTMLRQRVSNFIRKEHFRSRITGTGQDLGSDQSGQRHNQLLMGGEQTVLVDEVVLRVWWKERMEELSQRQRQVMDLLLEGLTEREVAACLKISGPAVHKLKQSAQKKLQKCW